MRNLVKLGIVLAGYGLACLAAGIVAYISDLRAQDPAAQASAGMSAFGDLILCLGVFFFMALFPTGLAILFVLPWEKIKRYKK